MRALDAWFCMWAALVMSLGISTAPPAVPAVCKAAPVAPGQIVRGPVLHVPSAGVLCVATGPDPTQWAPVALAQPAESRARLMAAAFGQNATCKIDRRGRGDCNIEAEPLGARLNRAAVIKASAAWR